MSRDEAFVFLDDGVPFPPPERARDDGLVAVGGKITVDRLLEAYRNGIFPWYESGGPVLWWSPDPRLVIDTSEIPVSRSLRAVIRKGTYRVTFDTAFRDVVVACARTPRGDGHGTWITPEVVAGYSSLHDLGYAHSVESRWEGKLVGGLYGVMLGRCFFGESMFSTRTDASKVAFVALAEELRKRGVRLVDGQVASAHLLSLGGKLLPRAEFLRRLREALTLPTDRGSWMR